MGRVSPNKRHEDLIRLAAYWKRFIAPDIRLLLVGKLTRRRHYFDTLQALLYEQGFTPAEVVFTGHVEHDDLLGQRNLLIQRRIIVIAGAKAVCIAAGSESTA